MYDPDRIPVPESFGKGETPILKWLHEALERGEAVRTSQDAFAVTEREAREIIALTYGMITMIDDAVGAILDRLRRRGLADDTVVIFTADHGDYMGDHSIMLKMLQHYHGLIRVPFLWADPAAQERGRTSKSLAQTIDIPATILARAGVQPYHGIQGRDLADARAPAPDGLVIEEDASRPMLGVKPPYRVRTYVTDRWRLTLHYDGGWAELYDLERDPHETRNLWDDRGHREVRAELTERMLKRMITLQDLAPLPTGRA
jgi:arylsulfatase A-like enzyme